MGNVVLMMTASIDGYVAAPHGHAGVLPEPDELTQWKLDRIRPAGTHIMGRVTYEEMASFWPTSTDDYAAPMNEIPKVVFSRTLKDAMWPESSIASGDIADEIATLRRQPGGARLMGTQVASAFMTLLGPDVARLCDEVELRSGTLLVTTSSPALAHQLRLDAQTILGRLNRPDLGRKVRTLRVRIGRSTPT